jgi:hypothetical protein
VNNGSGTNGSARADSVTGAALTPSLSERLRTLKGHVPPSEISDLWVFPPLADLEDSREFVLFTRLLPDGMRRVCAAEFTGGAGTAGGDGAGRSGPSEANGNGKGPPGGHGPGVNGNGHATGLSGRVAADRPRAESPAVRITEYGRVPSGRVTRVVDGFRRRLGDDREPLHLRIEGRPDSWDRLLAPDDAER